MSNIYDEDENDSDLVKDLRKQLKEHNKALKEAQESLGSLSARDRERTLADVLAESKASPKLAKFFPSDKDATEETVKAWLVENADVFGYKIDAPPADEPPAPAVPDGLQRLQNISTPSMAETGDAAVLHQINSTTSEQALLDMIRAAGGGGL